MLTNPFEEEIIHWQHSEGAGVLLYPQCKGEIIPKEVMHTFQKPTQNMEPNTEANGPMKHCLWDWRLLQVLTTFSIIGFFRAGLDWNSISFGLGCVGMGKIINISMSDM